MTTSRRDETVAYHAARLLLLIARCGTPQGRGAQKRPGIKGRTLLAKLDFFLRYPTYLIRAAAVQGKPLGLEDIGLPSLDEIDSVESRMVRYLYGPWDHVYYTALAYLIGKELIRVELEGGTEIFRLTDRGAEIAAALATDSAYIDLTQRARAVHQVFGSISGGRLKDFIYRHFPEIIGRKLGATI